MSKLREPGEMTRDERVATNVLLLSVGAARRSGRYAIGQYIADLATEIVTGDAEAIVNLAVEHAEQETLVVVKEPGDNLAEAQVEPADFDYWKIRAPQGWFFPKTATKTPHFFRSEWPSSLCGLAYRTPESRSGKGSDNKCSHCVASVKRQDLR